MVLKKNPTTKKEYLSLIVYDSPLIFILFLFSGKKLCHFHLLCSSVFQSISDTNTRFGSLCRLQLQVCWDGEKKFFSYLPTMKVSPSGGIGWAGK
jgi:hypothetical protein